MKIRDLIQALNLIKDYSDIKDIMIDLEYKLIIINTELDNYLIDVINKKVF